MHSLIFHLIWLNKFECATLNYAIYGVSMYRYVYVCTMFNDVCAYESIYMCVCEFV